MRKYNRPYVRNWNRYFTPVYIQGENYSFYLNSTLYDADFNYFQLWIIKTDGTQVIRIPYLTLVYVSGFVGYNLYIQNFVFPYIQNGQYYFQIYNSRINREVLRSNIIVVNEDCLDKTTLVSFRHNDQLYGVRYDLLPNFWQNFRLPICQIGPPEIRSERTQYRESANGRELRNSKSFRDLVFKLEFYWSDDIDLQAISAMLEHTDVKISGYKIIDMTQIKTDKPSEQSRLSKSTFDVIVDDYGVDTSSPEYYGECIVSGGSGYSGVAVANGAFINTFVIGN